MRYFFDTEFIEDGRTIDLLSIGVVAEDGRTFYAENIEADASKASEWVIKNVFLKLGMFNSKLDPGHATIKSEIARDLVAFIGDDPDPEFWAYYGAYDWVALCQLFGTMMDLPAHWPKHVMDLKQLALDAPLLVQPEHVKHHALADAAWTMSAYNDLMRRAEEEVYEDDLLAAAARQIARNKALIAHKTWVMPAKEGA